MDFNFFVELKSLFLFSKSDGSQGIAMKHFIKLPKPKIYEYLWCV